MEFRYWSIVFWLPLGMIIEKGHTFVNILALIHDYQGPTCNTTKEEWEAIKTLREDPSHVVLTADKGVALVVMDKSQYIDKCMALLNDTKVYKPCKDTTKKLHRDIQESLQKLNREHGTSRLYDWSKLYYNKLLPMGNSSPAPRFYGLPKIHKVELPHAPHSLSLWDSHLSVS